MKVLDLIEREEKLYVEVTKIYSKNESSMCEIVTEKEIRERNSAPPTSKIVATVWDKCLTMEKALNMYNKIFGDRPHSHNFYYSTLS